MAVQFLVKFERVERMVLYGTGVKGKRKLEVSLFAFIQCILHHRVLHLDVGGQNTDFLILPAHLMLEAKYPLMYSKQYMKQAFTLNGQSDMSFSKQKDNKM